MFYGFYGHGGWSIFLIFGVLFVLRALSSQRRRSRRRQVSTRSFASHDPMGAPQPDPQGSAGVAGGSFTGIAPGWFADPTGRHHQRYWSGSEWTEHVTDDGAPGTDPPPGPSNRHDPP